MVRSSLSIKEWRENPPSVETARPSCCPACGAPGRPVGGRVVLHGHGVRERQVRSIAAPFAVPALFGVEVRRYQCQRCGAVIVVVPAAVGRRRLFDLATIAFALARWLVDGLASTAVRTQVSPLAQLGSDARRSWNQLRRWARSVAVVLHPPRPVADGEPRTATIRTLEMIAATAPISFSHATLAERVFVALSSVATLG